MRRLIAFVIDCTIAGLVARFGFFLVESLSNRALFDPQIFWAVVGLLIVLFEHTHSGITPGRHLTGIKLISVTEAGPTLFSLFVRAEVLFLFPYCASFAFELIFHWVLQQEQFMSLSVADLSGGFFALLLFFGPLLVVSRGTQSFHDHVGQTAVVKSNSSMLPRQLSSRAVWITGILVLPVVTLWYFYFSYDNTRLTSALNTSPPSRAVQSMVSDPRTADIVISPQDIGPGISELHRYYAGVTYTTSVSSAHSALEKLNLIDQTVFRSLETGDEPIIEISSLLSFRGITDPAFQEQFGRNVCSAVDQRTGIRLCSVQFGYVYRLFGPLYATIRRKLITFRINSASLSASPIYVSVSPPSGIEYTFGLGVPDEVLMLEYLNRNPAQRQHPF